MMNEINTTTTISSTRRYRGRELPGAAVCSLKEAGGTHRQNEELSGCPPSTMGGAQPSWYSIYRNSPHAPELTFENSFFVDVP